MAAPPPASLRLAYAYGDVGKSDIQVYDVDRNDQTVVAQQGCDEAEPGWAPDGRTVVYQSDCSGNYDLYLVEVDSGRVRQVTATSREDEREPDISPDGNTIIYRSNGAGSDRNANGSLYLMDLGGNNVRYLGINGRAPDWSPSGRQVAYMVESGGTWNIHVYDLDMAIDRQVTNCAVNCRFPAWSSDGLSVVYHATTAPGGTTPDSIWRIPATGGSPVQLVTGDNPGRATMSATGSIAFNSNRGIEIVDAQGNYRQTLLNGNVHWAPDWSK